MLIILAFPFFILKTNPDFEHSQSFCPLKMLTGLPCPGCGITKSFVSIYQGELLKSLSFHIFGFFIMFLSAAALIILPLEIITGKEFFNNILYNRRFAYFLALILIAYHFVRIIIFIANHSFTQILQESVWL